MAVLKTLKALKTFSSGHISMYEGEVRELYSGNPYQGEYQQLSREGYVEDYHAESGKFTVMRETTGNTFDSSGVHMMSGNFWLELNETDISKMFITFDGVEYEVTGEPKTAGSETVYGVDGTYDASVGFMPDWTTTDLPCAVGVTRGQTGSVVYCKEAGTHTVSVKIINVYDLPPKTEPI